MAVAGIEPLPSQNVLICKFFIASLQNPLRKIEYKVHLSLQL